LGACPWRTAQEGVRRLRWALNGIGRLEGGLRQASDPDADTVHVLPTAWFRNTWSWDADAPKPALAGTGGSAITAGHPRPASA